MARAMKTHFKAKESQNASKCREMLKHTRAISSRFEANEQAQALQSSENGLKHTRAAKTHFGANEQTQALNSSENGLKHTLCGM